VHDDQASAQHCQTRLAAGTVAQGKVASANRQVARPFQFVDCPRNGAGRANQEHMRMVPDQRNPFEQFNEWFQAVAETEPNEPNAMALATVGADGTPSVRMVLLKGVDDRGFVFYTNYESRKGRQLLAHPKAALCFHWKSSKRQVRIEGTVEQVIPDE